MKSRALMIVAATATILALTACDKGLVATPEPSTSAPSEAVPDAEAVLKLGYTDVVTEVSEPIPVSGLGPFAPFSGPAVAGDGKVYLANESGKVTALNWDGSLDWNSDPSLPYLRVEVSPVVSTDGTIYVLGTYAARDHRGGATGSMVYSATLRRFSPEGALLGSTVLPEVNQAGPRAVGQPSLWRVGAEEALIVTALYLSSRGSELHLFAISPSGNVLDDWSVFHPIDGTVYGESGLDLPGFTFTPGRYAPPATPRFKGAVVGPGLRASPASIVLADVWDDKIYSFLYCTPATCDNQRGFVQVGSPIAVGREIYSVPTIVRPLSADTYSAVGVAGGIAFAGPSTNSRPTLTAGYDDVYATPTILPDGRMLVVDVTGDAIAVVDGAVVSRIELLDKTMAQPAASLTHVFISTTESFRVLDATGSTVLFTQNRAGGGTRAPVISPQGHVYDLAGDILFIHPRVRNGQPYIDPQDFQIR